MICRDSLDLDSLLFTKLPSSDRQNEYYVSNESVLCITPVADAFLPRQQLEHSRPQQQEQQHHAYDRMVEHEEASDHVLASPSQATSCGQVIEPTQLSDDDDAAEGTAAISQPFHEPDAAMPAVLGSYIYESVIPATCLEYGLLPTDSPMEEQQVQHGELEVINATQSPHHTPQHAHSAHQQQLAVAPQALTDSCSARKASKPQPLEGRQQQQQPQLPQQQSSDPNVLHPLLPGEGRQQQCMQQLPLQHVPSHAQQAAAAAAVAETDADQAKQHAALAMPSHGATAAPAGPTAPAGNKKQLSLLKVSRDARPQTNLAYEQQHHGHQQQRHNQQQEQQQQQQHTHYQQPQQSWQLQFPAVSYPRASAGMPSNMYQATSATSWLQQQQLVLQQQQQQQQQPYQGTLQGQPPAPGPTAWHVPAAGDVHHSRPSWQQSHAQQQQQQQQQQHQQLKRSAPFVPPAAPRSRRGPTAAAQAYRQSKPFKTPQRAPAGVPDGDHGPSGSACAAGVRPTGGGAAGGGLLSRPPGSFKPPTRGVQDSGAPVLQPAAAGCETAAVTDGAAAVTGGAEGMFGTAAAGDCAVGGFSTGRGGGIAVSAAAQARAAALLQGELGDLLAPELAAGLTASAAGVDALNGQQGGLMPPVPAASKPAEERFTAAATLVPQADAGVGEGLFATSRGGAIGVSAAAEARAAQLLQDELGPTEPAPFSEAQQPPPQQQQVHDVAPVRIHDTAAGPCAAAIKPDCPNAAPAEAVKAWDSTAMGVGESSSVAAAEAGGMDRQQQEEAQTHHFRAEASPSAAATAQLAGSCLGAFVSGRGSVVVVSAAAQARAAQLLQDELGADVAVHMQEQPQQSAAAGPSGTAARAAAGVSGPYDAPSSRAAATSGGAVKQQRASRGVFKAPRQGQQVIATGAAAVPAASTMPQQQPIGQGPVQLQKQHQPWQQPAVQPIAQQQQQPWQQQPAVQPIVQHQQQRQQQPAQALVQQQQQQHMVSLTAADITGGPPAAEAGVDPNHAAVLSDGVLGAGSLPAMHPDSSLDQSADELSCIDKLLREAEAQHRARRHAHITAATAGSDGNQQQAQVQPQAGGGPQQVPWWQQQQQQQQQWPPQQQQWPQQQVTPACQSSMQSHQHMQQQQQQRPGQQLPLLPEETPLQHGATGVAAAGGCGVMPDAAAAVSGGVAVLAVGQGVGHSGPDADEGLIIADSQPESPTGCTPLQQTSSTCPSLSQPLRPAWGNKGNSQNAGTMSMPTATAGVAGSAAGEGVSNAPPYAGAEGAAAVRSSSQPGGHQQQQHPSALAMPAASGGMGLQNAATAAGGGGQAAVGNTRVPRPQHAGASAPAGAAGASTAHGSSSSSKAEGQQPPLPIISGFKMTEALQRILYPKPPPMVAIPGRSFWPEAQLQHISTTRPAVARAAPAPTATAGVSGAAAGCSKYPDVPVSLVQWASGDGVQLPRDCLDAGQLFVGRMVSLGLLAPAWQGQALLAELAVAQDGRVALLLGVLPQQQRQQQPLVAAINKVAAAAALTGRTATGHAPATPSGWQQQQASSGTQGRHLSSGSGGVNAGGRPPLYSQSGRRKSAGGGKGAKPGLLQALWGRAAAAAADKPPREPAAAAASVPAASTKRGQAGKQPPRRRPSVFDKLFSSSSSIPAPQGPTEEERQFQEALEASKRTAELEQQRQAAMSAQAAPPAPAAAAAASAEGVAGHAVMPGGQRDARTPAGSKPATAATNRLSGGKRDSPEPPQQEQQQKQKRRSTSPTPAAAAGASAAPAQAPVSSGLMTAGGRPVAAAGAAAQQQLQQMLAAPQQQQVSVDAAAAHCSVLVQAASRDPAGHAGPAQGAHSAQREQLQQQQQQQAMGPPRPRQPAPAAAAAAGPAAAPAGGGSGLSTAGGRRLQADPAAMQEFRRRVGYQPEQPQPQQVNQADGQPPLQQQQLPQQQEQQQRGQQPSIGGSGLTTAGGRGIEVDAAAKQRFMQMIGGQEPQQQQQPQQLQQEQQQCQQLAVGASGLATAGGRGVEVDAAAKQKFMQMMSLPVVEQGQQPAAATGGLTTAGGKHVEVNAAARQRFMQIIDAQGPQQQQQQQEAVRASGLTTAGGKGVQVDAAAKRKFMQSIGAQEPQQQQQENAVGASGLSTAGGRGIEVDAAAMQKFKQMMGGQEPQQQQQQQQQQHAVGASGLSTAGGKGIEVDAAAKQRFMQMMNVPTNQQQQQDKHHQELQQNAAAGGGLSTAGGRGVDVSAAAKQQLMQMLGLPPVSRVTGPQHNSSTTAKPVSHSSTTTAAAAAAAAAAASPAVTTPDPSRTPAPSAQAAAAVTPGATPSPAPGTAFSTPGLPPRINSRKRPLQSRTPGPLQQQQQVEDGSAGKAARKAFRPPAMAAGTTPHRPPATPKQQQQQGPGPAAAGTSSSAKKQRVQQEPAARGLGLQEYFAIARSHLQQQQQGSHAADAVTSSSLCWVVADSLPATPAAAAAFAFQAATPQAPSSTVLQQQQQQDSGASSSSATAPAPSCAGAVFGAAEARAALLAWGADPDKVSAAWVANHFKWIVWKLAAYDRKLLGLGSSASASGSSSVSSTHSRCLSAACVMQQLSGRYTREVTEGQRSVLKKILEQDLPAGVPLVLLVSEIRTRASAADTKQQQQQQQQQSGPAAAGDGVEVLGMQLSDGWYYVNCMVDLPLTELIQQGRLQVGTKVRVVGAELVSGRAAEPLDAARTALLKLSFNGVSPVPWDTKLGPAAAGETLRPLSRVHPAGGLVARLLLLVCRRYPRTYWSRSSKAFVTPKLLAAAQQRAERQQEQALHAASAAALREEMDQCRLWAGSRAASAVQRAYAAAVLTAEGGAAGDVDGSGAVNGLELQAFRASRENHLESRKQHHMQQQLQKTAADGSTAAPGQQQQQESVSAAVAAAAMVSLADNPVPVMHLRVVGVVPQGCGASWGYGEAVLKVWRPCEAVQQLDEGVVVLATGLSAGTDGRSSTVDRKGKVLELSSGRMTSWQLLGAGSSLSSSLDVPAWQPRSTVNLGQLRTSCQAGAEVDFSGVLVWAGDVNRDGRDWMQWIFLTDESAAGAVAGAGEGQQPGGQGAGLPAAAGASAGGCCLLAVCLAGPPTAVDWLPPSAPAAAEAAASSRGTVRSSSSSSRPVRAAAPPALRFVFASGLVLQSYDAARRLCVAEAHTHSAVHALPGSDMRVRGLSAWARQNPGFVEACRAQVHTVLGT